MTGAGLTVDRSLIAAAVVLTCVLFLPDASDPVNVVKLTALLLAGIGLLVSAAARVLKARVVHLPVSPAAVAAVVLLLGFAASAATAPVATTALLGAYGRNSGLLAYATGVLLFVAALRALALPATRVLVGAVAAAGLFTAGYGLLQRAGVDPVDWNNPFNPVIAALGNPNFASAYAGIAAAAAAGGALYSGWSRAWRTACAGTLLLCLAAAVLSSSVQGPIAAAAGLTVVVTAWLLDAAPPRRSAGLAAVAAAVAAGVGLLLAGLVAGAGPAASVFQDAGSRARGYYWEAAVTMFTDRPLLGVGLDHYGSYWRSARSEQSLEFLADNDFADAAHSVPLQMLAQGGLVLGLCYAAFVLTVAAALVRGLLRLRGADRVLLSAVGGAWAAYQVQSLVSIDQIPLMVLHFTLAGAVVAASGTLRVREVRLPGAPAVRQPGPAPTRSRRRGAAAVLARERTWSSGDKAALVGVGAAALVAAFLALGPLRANVLARTGDLALAAGDGTAAGAAYDRATDLAPGQPVYWLKKASLFDRVTPPQPTLAQAAYESAVQADPREVAAVRALARLADARGDVEAARSLHRRALALSPVHEDVVLAAADFEAAHDGQEQARALLRTAADRPRSSAQLWARLGQVEAALGDTAAARSAYERALAIDPNQSGAVEGLSALS